MPPDDNLQRLERHEDNSLIVGLISLRYLVLKALEEEYAKDISPRSFD